MCGKNRRIKMGSTNLKPSQNLSSEAVIIDVKSFILSRKITDKDFFSKIELKPVSRIIITQLTNMYNPQLGYTFPSIAKLASCTGYSEKQIKAGLKELRQSGLIFTTDNGKKIYFTRKFYELLEIIEPEKNELEEENTSKKGEDISTKKEDTSSEIIPKPAQILSFSDPNRILKHNINNNDFKKPFFNKTDWQNQPEQKNHLSVEKTKRYLEEQKNIKTGSPLDYTKEQAEIYLKNLMPELRNSYFAKELRKKWKINA